MKKLCLLLLLLSLNLCAEILWSSSLDQGKIKAQDENKLILLMLSKENCDACWYMKNIVFDKVKVQDLVLSHFIPVYVDIQEGTVPKDLTYIGTPSFYFLDAKGKVIGMLEGILNAKEFKKKLLKIVKEESKY